jgi:alginate O-acetyltransferase complex protein AlgF
MRNILATIAFFGLSLMSFTGSVFAGADDGLYDPVAPEGSAFVRYVNTDAEEAAPSVNGKSYDKVVFAAVTPYYVVPKGDADIKFGAGSAKQTVEAGKFYTAVLQKGAVKVIADTVSANRAKAQLALYNLTEKATVTLKANDKIEVVKEVAAGTVGTMDVNAMKIKLAVFSGSDSLGDAGEQNLERGFSYGVFAIAKADGTTQVVAVKAETDTKK